MNGVKDLIGPLVGLALVVGALVVVMKGGLGEWVSPVSPSPVSANPVSPSREAGVEPPSNANPRDRGAAKVTPLPGDTTVEGAAKSPGQGQIAQLLGQLKVAKREWGADYDRNYFGEGWVDVDHNTCFTRADILARDLEGVKKKGRCKVQSGTLNDPYTGKTIAYTAGPDTSEAVQIDHVVALLDAWGTGAQTWDEAKRVAFANDPLNLLAVDGPTNDHKGHKNAAKWLPPNSDFHCHYVARQIAVKARYGLWVTADEQRALAKVLASCPPDMAVQGDTITGLVP